MTKCSIGEKEYLTTEETMAYLGVKSAKTIRNYESLGLKSNQINGKKWYSKKEISKFMDKFLI